MLKTRKKNIGKSSLTNRVLSLKKKKFRRSFFGGGGGSELFRVLGSNLLSLGEEKVMETSLTADSQGC